MAIKFERIQVGMVLWSKMTRKMGNTRRRETSLDQRHVVAVDAEKRRVLAEWNARQVWVPEHQATKWYAKKPAPRRSTP